MGLPRIVIIGGGFGGLQVAFGLKNVPAQVTLIDQNNYHVFQPLLYQVATGGLSPANIAAPLRALMRNQMNTQVLLGTVTDVDVAQHQVASERCPTSEETRRWLTFVIVGGGPTGVELAGALGELRRQTLNGNFRKVDPSVAEVILLQAEDRILPTFPHGLSDKAAGALMRLGVKIYTLTTAIDVLPGRLIARVHDGSTLEFEAETILWAAGVKGASLGQRLAEATQTELDRHGRVAIEPDLTIERHPEILVIGDLAHCGDPHGQPLPALAPVAIQQGRYAAKLIRARLDGRSLPPFRYKDRGTMAAIGRGIAVVDLKRLRFDGWFGWLAWLFIHLLYVEQFENRLLILIQWAWNYITRNRSARLITGKTEVNARDEVRHPPQTPTMVAPPQSS